MQIVAVQFDPVGANAGTFSHPAITESSVIQATLVLDPNEDISPIMLTLIGPPRAGAQDWKLNQGGDNDPKINFTIFNGC